MSQALPARPHVDWYRKSAKKKLAKLRRGDPSARLADAQLAVARDHGFSSWRALKASIDEVQHELPRLFDAIQRGQEKEMRRLLKAHPELANLTDGDGQTALHVAAEKNQAEAVTLLLSHKAKTDAFYGHSAHTALSWALTVRAFDAARALVRGGVTPDLFCAAGLGDLKGVRSFFDTDGSLAAHASRTGSSRTQPDWTPLPRPPEEPREIISDALYFACRNGHVTVVRELMRHDPDLRFHAYMGGTPLHYAYFGAKPEIVEMLLTAGANPALRDYVFNCTPRAFGICMAASWGIMTLVKRNLRHDPTLVNVHDGRGTPLHEAARSGHAGIVRMLLKAGADPAMLDVDGNTPLDHAKAGGHSTTLKLLQSN